MFIKTAIAILAISQFSRSNDSVISEANNWLNHNPSDKLYGNNNKSLFEMPEFKKVISKTLSKNDLKIILTEYTVETPLESKGSLYYFSRCKPHFCSDNYAVIVLNSLNSDLLVYTYDSRFGSIRSSWYGDPKKKIILSPELSELTEM